MLDSGELITPGTYLHVNNITRDIVGYAVAAEEAGAENSDKV